LVEVGEGELLGGRYRMVERLGAGGMSEVWRGHDEILDRPVAIKMLAGRQASDHAVRRRIRIEAKAAARLSHPYITNVYDYGEASEAGGEPIPFVVLELVDGVTMATCLAGERALPWPAAVRACAQVAAALAEAHAHGIVHRDVKPGNVMLTPAGVKVLDFGISALVGDPDVDDDGMLLGTPAYLAPERLNRIVVTPASDVYGLGLLLHRSLTGCLPWRADTPTQILKAHLHVEPDPLPPVDGLPPEVAALVERCLAKDPADRPTSEQAARELTDVLATAPQPASASLAASVDIRPRRWPTTTDTAAALAHRLSATCKQSTAVRRGTPGRLRRPVTVAGMLASAGLLCAAAAVAAVWPTGTHKTPGTPAEAADNGGARPGSCAVRYEVSRDTGSAMAANLTVTNTGTRAFPRWQLSFDLPGDQQLRRGTNANWRQDDHTVTARSADAVLAPAGTARLTFTASYHTGNPLPVTYHVNSIACSAVVVGLPDSRPRTTPTHSTQADRTVDGERGTKKEHGKGEGKDKGKDKDKG
jgi:serine/threonine protein kinase